MHLLALALLTASFVAVLAARWRQPLAADQSPGPDPARLRQVEQRIDPNTANRAELARLPGIGEVLARRIVAHREALADTSGDGQPVVAFTGPDDLAAIKGIGPKKLAAIRPFLRFPGPESRPAR